MDSLFERMCEARGRKPLDRGALNSTDQVEVSKSLGFFNWLNEEHGRSRNPGLKIEIGFYDSHQVNAFATIFEGADVIAISWEAVKSLRDLFHDVLDLPVLTWIDEPYRPAAATWLYRCGMHFIFMHELGHVWHGHTSLVERHGIATMDEVTAFPDGTLGNLDRQTLEFDADAFAATNVFNYTVFSCPFPVVNPAWEDFGHGMTSLIMTAFSLHLLFRVFDKAVNFDLDAQRPHPSPPLRQLILAETMTAQAEEKGGFLSASEIIEWGIKGAEEAYAKRQRMPFDDTAIQEAKGPEGKKYIAKLLRNWHSIRPQLDPLKRGGLLPPTQEVDDGFA
ncbi:MULTISPECIES: hypothetical protein [unclassified Rhizobium]|uniref:hypothetical protein n=1 Tax=unclassified Rhizobium TaxID=2613769 RepID=UPI001616319B|nr:MULTISPECIES: hypothetical protein [unclassified Rhizobium]MBB3286684.1 hypothetical protein [Rhizobium sp. BK252]MBB3401122.1 hypothetical protein [Rhizobium sp. BK289]MBB3413700.1 hypothetical protein [Rhizobium sp. BK284]MBB3481587.1 hypothetical protein [Rhizobium sp. BK347]